MYLLVAEHNSMVLVLTGCAVGVTMPNRRQDGELVLGPVVVADIGCQQDIGRGLVGPLDGGGVPLAPGDLIGIGSIGQRRAGHHGQLHSRRRNGGTRRNGGHGGELDVGPGCIAGPAADVQPQAGAALHAVAFPDEIIQDIGLGTAGGHVAPGVLVGAFDFHPNAIHQLVDRVGIDLHLIRAVGHQEMLFILAPEGFILPQDGDFLRLGSGLRLGRAECLLLGHFRGGGILRRTCPYRHRRQQQTHHQHDG